MTRILTTLLCLAIALISMAQKPKYVIFMIGDGMGVNQIGMTERYKAAINGSNGRVPLCMTQFPITGYSHTYSKSYGTTDSAAGGTALSTGVKTSNSTVAMDSARIEPLTTIAERAKKKGLAVGVTTSVSIDHATPAVFYAHTPLRKMYYEIGQQLPTSNFDFFGGAWFVQPNGKDGNQPDLEEIVKKAGYTTLKGYDEYLKNGKKNKKVILTQTDERAKIFKSGLPYAIDREEGDLQLEQITKAAIDFLYNKNKKDGFFLMVEGGQIDWACHANDPGALVNEIIDFDNAISAAYEFYKQHKDETLIVISADHETGGFSIGRDNLYNLELAYLQSQKCSQSELSNKISTALNDKANEFTYDVMKKIVSENTGLWNNIKMNGKDDADMREAYDKTVRGKAEDVKSEYFKDALIAATALKILSRKARIGWTTGGHTSGFVPVFAIGAGAERFSGVIENIDIPNRIAELAGY